MKDTITASLQRGNTFVLGTKATLDDSIGFKKFEAPKKVADELKFPFYYVLAKAEVNPLVPG